MSFQFVNTQLLNIYSLQGVCLVIMINYTFINMFYILYVFIAHCTFVTVAMFDCLLVIKKYLLTYLLTYVEFYLDFFQLAPTLVANCFMPLIRPFSKCPIRN